MSSVKKLLRMFLLSILFVGCGTTGSTSESELELASETGGGGEQECAFTQGYWKNHPEAWPVASLTLGDVEYSKDELLAIYGQPVAGNGLISLAHQLIAAKLNLANGAEDSDISDEIAAADALIGALVVPPGGVGYLSPSSTSALVGALDQFNNTGECDSGPECGNGVVEEGEQCDDGNDDDTDACRNDCTLCPPPPVCGNGVVEEGEQCDDGNESNIDACLGTCVAATCGDSYVQAGVEQCDDGNDDDTDACRNDCTLCPPPPVCGNGVVEEGEQCDDGNTVDNDYCSNLCEICVPSIG